MKIKIDKQKGLKDQQKIKIDMSMQGWEYKPWYTNNLS